MTRAKPRRTGLRGAAAAAKKPSPRRTRPAAAPAPAAPEPFRAILLENVMGAVRARLAELSEGDLHAHAPPDADVTLRVLYSTINYKDGLALMGRGNIVRTYPHVPGVDLVGEVLESESPRFRRGQKVIAGGFRMGEIYWGGFAGRARVKGDWLVPLPKGLSPLRAMAIGTAGLTAMLAVMALEQHGLKPDAGEVLVTGAAGGVGSIAVALLGKLGYRVVAATGRMETGDYLRRLGAAEVIDRTALSSPPAKPLLPGRWAGAVDAVGGAPLANILASLKYGGSVAATGLVAGHALSASVIPFLLRGVNLLGIEATACPIPRRQEAWARLVRDLPADLLDAMTKVEPLARVPELGAQIVAGRVQGRIVVDVNA